MKKSPSMSEEEYKLWKKYKNTKHKALREEIVKRYLYLVKYVAGRVAIGLPPNVEFNDLVSYGILGLFDAIDKYDISQGNKFENDSTPSFLHFSFVSVLVSFVSWP